MKPSTYIDELGHHHTESTDEPLLIFYDWQAELPADPWHKNPGWRKVGYKMTWRAAEEYAKQRGIDFETQMRNDEGSVEFREPIEGWGSPHGRGGLGDH
jgi:hypothetical protein